ncbi:hypothetical protein D9M68_812810 [compost metagenome]
MSRHHGGAGLGVAADHHTIGWSQQQHVVALLLQTCSFGRQTLDVLARGCQVRIGSGHRRLGRELFLLLGLHGAGAHEFLRAQLDVALRRGGRQFAPGLGVAPLRLRCNDGTAATRD